MSITAKQANECIRMSVEPYNVTCLMSGLRAMTEAVVQSSAISFSANGILKLGNDEAIDWIAENYDLLRGLIVTISSSLGIIDDAIINGDIYIGDGEEVNA